MKIAVRRLAKSGYDLDEEDISDCFDVAIGEGQDRFFVTVRDGHVEISTPYGQLAVLPRAANTAWLRRERF